MKEGGRDCPSPFLRALSTGAALELPEYRNRHADQTGGAKHTKQRIRRDHLEHVPNHRCQCRHSASNGRDTSSSLDAPLLPLKVLVAGVGFEPTFSRVRIWRVNHFSIPRYLKIKYKGQLKEATSPARAGGPELRPSGAPLRYSGSPCARRP